jgi:cytochrome c2
MDRTTSLLARTGIMCAVFAGSAALAHCSGDDTSTPLTDAGGDATTPRQDGGPPRQDGGPTGQDSGPDATPMPSAGSDGPDSGPNPNVHQVGNAANGKMVFRMETFGDEGFWTDAVKLPQGIVAAKLTPVQALGVGLSVDVEALDLATQQAVAAELKAMGTKGPLLNSFDTTVKLLNANAVIGAVVKDSNGDGKLDVTTGDKVGVTCNLCHGITDGSVASLPTGGGIGKRVDGPGVHNIDIGAIFAIAANSRALYPLLQLKQADGTSIGRAPSAAGLTKTSTEADVDAYFTNKDYFPVGMFDDTVDGNGNPMHNTPMFRTDLAAPWGSAGEFQFLDQFANTVYTVLLDQTNLLTPGGKAFLHKVAGAGGDALAADYASVLAATGVTAGDAGSGYPYVRGSTTTQPGDPNGVLGIRVDNQKLLDMNAYLNSLRSPAGTPGDATAIAHGRSTFRTIGKCTTCHNVDQSTFVPPMIIDMKTMFPGDNPKVLAQRDPPLNPVEDTAGNTFDDKMIVINASIRGLSRGSAMPLLMDLARKPVFLHDNSVPTLDNLLDPARGASAPHPFYLADTAQRSDMVQFLQSLDDTSK